MEPEDKLGRSDVVALAAIWLFFVVRCALLGGGVMWVDELFSLRMIHDPSVGHMLHALGDQSDGAPPGYYLAAKAWCVLFPESPMSLRMFSTVAFCLGLTILWRLLRLTFNFFPVFLAVVMIFSRYQVLAFETLNVRFYGLLFMLIALATFLGVQFCRSARATTGLLLTNVLTSAALVLCHPLGGFYSAAILAGVVISSLLSRPIRIRPPVVLSYLIGWMAIFLWFKQFLHQANLNSPHGWIPEPGGWSLLNELNSENSL